MQRRSAEDAAEVLPNAHHNQKARVQAAGPQVGTTCGCRTRREQRKGTTESRVHERSLGCERRLQGKLLGDRGGAGGHPRGQREAVEHLVVSVQRPHPQAEAEREVVRAAEREAVVLRDQ